MTTRRSHKPQNGGFNSRYRNQIQTGHSLIGKTVGLYPILAADYREITGSNPVAPIRNFIQISIQKTILPEQTRTKILRGQKNAVNPFFCSQ